MKKLENASLRKEVAIMVLNGEISDQDVECLYKGEPVFSTRVLKSFDIMADGTVRKHETTEEEVMMFVSRHQNYDELMVAIEDERNKYTQRAERAKKAREKIGKKEESECDNSAQLLGDGITNATDLTSVAITADKA